MCCTPLRLSLWFAQRSSPRYVARYVAHRGDNFVIEYRGEKSKPNSKIHTLGCLSGGRWVRIMKKIRGKNLVTHSLNLTICLSFYLCAWYYRYLSVCSSHYLSIFLSVCLVLSLSICLFISLSVYLSIYLPGPIAIYLYVHLTSCLSFYLCAWYCRYLSFCLSLYLSSSIPIFLSASL